MVVALSHTGPSSPRAASHCVARPRTVSGSDDAESIFDADAVLLAAPAEAARGADSALGFAAQVRASLTGHVDTVLPRSLATKLALLDTAVSLHAGTALGQVHCILVFITPDSLCPPADACPARPARRPVCPASSRSGILRCKLSNPQSQMYVRLLRRRGLHDEALRVQAAAAPAVAWPRVPLTAGPLPRACRRGHEQPAAPPSDRLACCGTVFPPLPVLIAEHGKWPGCQTHRCWQRRCRCFSCR